MNILLVCVTDDKFTGYGRMTNGIREYLDSMFDKKEISRFDIIVEYKGITTNSDLLSSYDITITIASHYSLYSMIQQHPWLHDIYKTSTRNVLNIIFETDPLPAEFKEVINLDYINEFMVNSFFMVDILQKETTKPVYYVPCRVYEDQISEVPLEQRLNETTFRVLIMGQHSIRKGLADGLIGYCRELSMHPDTSCVIKCNKLSNIELPAMDYYKFIIDTNISRGGRRDISISPDILSENDIATLINKSSLLVFASRGEGFGLPAAEAMLSGTPVLYTNWSGLPEICNLEGNYPVDYILDEAYGMMHMGYTKNIKYAIPLVSSIMEQMNKAYSKWKENKTEYYKSNRDIIVSKYGKDANENHLRDMINGKKETSSRT